MKLKEVEITWTGKTTDKNDREQDIALGFTLSERGAPTQFNFGGVPDLVKSLKVGDKVNLEIVVQPGWNTLYTDIIKIESVGVAEKVKAGLRVAV